MRTGIGSDVLSAYDIVKTPTDTIVEIPIRMHPETGKPWGTFIADHALYLMKLGFSVELHSFDVWVTDMSWQGKDKDFLLERLHAVKENLSVPSLGKAGTGVYIDGYTEFIEAGGNLVIAQHPTVQLLTDGLQSGPLSICVCYQSLYGTAKERFLSDGKNIEDDDSGIPVNHTIVVSDYMNSQFEVYNPWHERQVLWVDEQTLLMGIMAAQIECDNQVLLVKKNNFN